MAERLTVIFKIYNYHFATSYELNSIKFYSHLRAQSTNKNLDDPVLGINYFMHLQTSF